MADNNYPSPSTWSGHVTRVKPRSLPKLRGQSFDQSDDDDLSLAESRTRAERAAEFEIEHDWLLRDEAEKQRRKFERTKKLLTITLQDEDPMEGIENRLDEVQAMVKPKPELLAFLKEMGAGQSKNMLAKMEAELLRKNRRNSRRYWQLLKHAFRMVYVISCLANSSRRYFYFDDPDAGPAVMRKQRIKYKAGRQQPIKSSMSSELQHVLMTNPDYRTEDQIKKILWLLRTTKAFLHLFPAEMSGQLARVLAYERYDDNRHIAYQGKQSERFYYVLSGKVQKFREYKLSSGCVNKLLGCMVKGNTTDPEEMEDHSNREHHLVSHGQAEVLFLTKHDFLRLQHTTPGTEIPVDFLNSMDLFREFPCHVLSKDSKTALYKYYGQNKVITPDVDKTPWIHIVKSGQVKVVRCQYVADVRADSSPREGEATQGRSSTHAQAMLGNLTKQRRLRKRNNISLPERGESATVLPAITVSFQDPEPPPPDKPSSANESLRLETPMERLARQPQRVFLTREKTTAEPEVLPEKLRREKPVRATCVQLDVLRPGDIFGLEDVAKKLRFDTGDMDEEETDRSLPDIHPLNSFGKVALVSDGAEVVKVSKRCFLQHAKNNTILKVDIMQRSYLSPNEASDLLKSQDNWLMYKTALMKRLLANLTR